MEQKASAIRGGKAALMSEKKRISLYMTTLAALLVSLFCLAAIGREESVTAVAQVEMPQLSTGFAVLSVRYDIALAGLAGEEIVFDPEDFERALDLSAITCITVTEIPPVTDGELRLGAQCVRAGQRIPRGMLDLLAFVPASPQISQSFFSFRSGENGHVIRCALYLLPAPNAAPTVAEAETVGGICEHMSYRGQIVLCDPEGDEVRAVLVTPPSHGSLIWLDAAQGRYLYRPAAGFAGEDSFSVIAVDQWGNTSAEQTVTVHVGVCAVGG